MNEKKRTGRSVCAVADFSNVTDENVRAYMKLIYKIIYEVDFGDELNLEEKVSSGLVGIAVALSSFDPTKGIKPSHWVAWNVKKQIFEDARLYCRQRRYAKDKNLQRATFEADERRKDDNSLNLTSTLRDLDEEKKTAILKNAMGVLNEDERLFIQRVFLGSLTQKEFARERGFSQSWASRVQRRALQKMRTKVGDLEEWLQ